MGSVSKNNHSCCGAVGVHESCLTSRQEASRCNAILLEKTSLLYWLPLPNITASSSQTEPFIAHMCEAGPACFPKMNMPPKATVTWVLCALTSEEHLKKWCHGSCVQMDGSPYPNTNGQHSGALRFQENKTKWPETFIRKKKKWECYPHNPVLKWLWLLTAFFKRNCRTKLK